MLPGRWLRMAATSSGVSTHSVASVRCLLSWVSNEKKKNSLLRHSGPPRLAAVWLSRRSTRCGRSPAGPSHPSWNELSPGVLRLNTRLPWKSLVPFCETTCTCAPLLRPCSAE